VVELSASLFEDNLDLTNVRNLKLTLGKSGRLVLLDGVTATVDDVAEVGRTATVPGKNLPRLLALCSQGINSSG
jgi:hypothetical protein